MCNCMASEVSDWGQIDEHCWYNDAGGQKVNHLKSHLNTVETCVINMIIQNLYFGFCQTSQPDKGPVKLIQTVNIAHSFLELVSNLFHFIILSLFM